MNKTNAPNTLSRSAVTLLGDTHPVSHHAVVRYFERLHGLGLTDRYPHATDGYRAAMGCERLGLTLDEARDLVCPPRLRPALAMGLTGYVKAGDRTLPIRDGVVVTCLELAVNPRKCRQRAEREKDGGMRSHYGQGAKPHFSHNRG